MTFHSGSRDEIKGLQCDFSARSLRLGGFLAQAPRKRQEWPDEGNELELEKRNPGPHSSHLRLIVPSGGASNLSHKRELASRRHSSSSSYSDSDPWGEESHVSLKRSWETRRRRWATPCAIESLSFQQTNSIAQKLSDDECLECAGPKQAG